MQLAALNFTRGDTRQFTVDYCDWLPKGARVVTAAVTSSDPLAVISNVVVIERARVNFQIAGPTVKNDFTVNLVATDSLGEVTNDTLAFHAVDP